MKKFFNKAFGRFFMALAGLMLAGEAIAKAPAGSFDFSTVADKAQSGLKATLEPVINIVSILVALIAVVMLIWNYVKRSKSDGQSNDALASWAVALIFVFVALQAIKFIFL